jgi:hypothetical protein
MIVLGVLCLSFIAIWPELRRSMLHSTSKTTLWSLNSKTCQSSGDLKSASSYNIHLLCIKSSSLWACLPAPGSPHSVATGPQNPSRLMGATRWCHYRPKLKLENNSPGDTLPCLHSHLALTSKINAAQNLQRPLYARWSPKHVKVQVS